MESFLLLDVMHHRLRSKNAFSHPPSDHSEGFLLQF